MNSMAQPQTLHEQIMVLCRELFEGGHYEAAYHLLSACVHYNKDTANEENLKEILTLAEQQFQWVNERAPENVMSTQSAHKRSGLDFYPMLIRQARASLLMVHENRRRSEAHYLRPVDE
jgi:hypothetical protein